MNQSNSFVEHSSSKSSMNFLQTHSICQSSCKVYSLDKKSFFVSPTRSVSHPASASLPLHFPNFPTSHSLNQQQLPNTGNHPEHATQICKARSSSCFVCTSFPPPQMHSCFMLITKLCNVFVTH